MFRPFSAICRTVFNKQKDMWLVITQMCNNRAKLQHVKVVKIFKKCVVQDVCMHIHSLPISPWPVRQEPELSQATGMALAHCILGKFLGVGCHYFPPHVCIYVYSMYVCIYIRMCVCIYLCLYVCVYMYECIYLCIYICVCIYVYTYVYVCVYVCMYVCVFVCSRDSKKGS
jgi:hypothetical protein